MNTDTVVIVIALITTLFTILAFINNLSKKVDDMKDEIINMKVEVANIKVELTNRITNLEVEMANRMTNLEVKLTNRMTSLEIKVDTGFQKINSKLDVSEERVNTTNVRLDDTNKIVERMEMETIKELKAEIKEIRTEQKSFENKIFDILNAPKVQAH